MKVGVLALQGSFEPHMEHLRALRAEPREVRQLRDLEGITHLVLPGGESTTLQHLLRLFGLWEEIEARARRHELRLFGTCAGAILLAQEDGTRPPRFGLLDAQVERNAYGRQRDSFSDELPIDGLQDPRFHAVFIRAPRFRAVGPEVEVLARRGDEPVLARAPGILAATFHPELTPDLRLHRFFLEAV